MKVTQLIEDYLVLEQDNQFQGVGGFTTYEVASGTLIQIKYPYGVFVDGKFEETGCDWIVPSEITKRTITPKKDTTKDILEVYLGTDIVIYQMDEDIEIKVYVEVEA